MLFTEAFVEYKSMYVIPTTVLIVVLSENVPTLYIHKTYSALCAVLKFIIIAVTCYFLSLIKIDCWPCLLRKEKEIKIAPC